MRYHPDKNQGSAESTAMFQQISAAYQTLITKDDVVEGGKMSYVDAIALYNAIMNSLFSPNASYAWASLKLFATPETRTPEERQEAWTQQELNRQLFMYKLENGLKKNQHPLACAIREHNVEDVSKLLTSEESTVEDLGIGNTPMHYACYFGHKDVVELLLAKGGKKALSQRNMDGNKPLELAQQECHFELASYLKGVLGVADPPSAQESFTSMFGPRPDWRRHFRSSESASTTSPSSATSAPPATSSTESPRTSNYTSKFSLRSSAPSKSYSQILEERVAKNAAGKPNTTTYLFSKNKKPRNSTTTTPPVEPCTPATEPPVTFAWQSEHERLLSTVDHDIMVALAGVSQSADEIQRRIVPDEKRE
eukprot:TRINITY_DN3605_c0_g1_i1.p1 TRINITY_DN3605_c0_g1~~TRINITY_DN3605_c0_g1_i1.p1  ORF type:complete len:366 (-),score=88.30 TRINITY_DN3605_c0_g1_i1:43-1140(-)